MTSEYDIGYGEGFESGTQELRKRDRRIADLESALKISTEQASGFLNHLYELEAQIALMKEHCMDKIGCSTAQRTGVE
jgi:hypothetical protein